MANLNSESIPGREFADAFFSGAKVGDLIKSVSLKKSFPSW